MIIRGLVHIDASILLQFVFAFDVKRPAFCGASRSTDKSADK